MDTLHLGAWRSGTSPLIRRTAVETGQGSRCPKGRLGKFHSSRLRRLMPTSRACG